MNITGDVCVYFPVENVIKYIIGFFPKLSSKNEELLLGATLLRLYENLSPNDEFLIGFPVLDKHISKYQNHFLNDADVAHFFEKDRKEATHVDLAIITLRNGIAYDENFYQLKRFGQIEPYKNDDDLIALLKSLEKNPKTGVTLLIHVKLAHITVSKAYLWLRGKDFPYENVVLFSAEPYGTRVLVGMTYIYPYRAIGTFGVNLTPGVKPYGLIIDWRSALAISFRVAMRRAYDRLMYIVINQVLRWEVGRGQAS